MLLRDSNAAGHPAILHTPRSRGSELTAGFASAGLRKAPYVITGFALVGCYFNSRRRGLNIPFPAISSIAVPSPPASGAHTRRLNHRRSGPRPDASPVAICDLR